LCFEQPMFKEIKSQKGQGSVGLVVAAVISFMVLSLGIVLTNNFYNATGQTPAFNSLWPLVLAGVVIIGVLVAGLGRLGVLSGG
jgi:hypothetical protein